MTEQQNKKDMLEIRAFSEEICLDGNTYYDSHSRLFNVIRLPAAIKHLYPHIQRKKMKFEIRCFPDKESLENFLETHNTIPLVVSLFEREEEIRNTQS
jgi:hypothetical protein